MNLLLEIPRDVLFLLVQQLDICDITRLCQTSKEMLRKIIPRVHRIDFSSNRIWRLEKEKEKESEHEIDGSRINVDIETYGLMQSQRRFIRIENPSHYSLTLPPIYLLNQYPSLTNYTVPFLGSVSDLLDVDPASLVKIVNQCHELQFICTYPAVPMTKYWTPLPSNGHRNLH